MKKVLKILAVIVLSLFVVGCRKETTITGTITNIAIKDEQVKITLKAQEKIYPIAMKEIQNGKKLSHWMWYIFPQLRGLGTSSMAHIYGLSGLEEARAYLEHPWLSGRLYELCVALLHHKDKSAYEIFGDVDEMKLKSSMTLFALTSEDYTIFDQVLEQFFDGEMDEVTVRLINK